MRKFRSVDARFIFRTIAIEIEKHHRPGDAQQRKYVENPAPAPCVHDHDGNQRRNRDGEPAKAMRHTLDEATLGFWKPELHGAAGRRECAGFSQAKGEADHNQRRRARRPGRSRRHQRPERDDHQQHPLRPEKVSEPAAGHLTRGIGPGERAENQRDFGLVETKLPGDGRRRNRNIAAVHIGDHVHQADQQKHVPPDVATLRTGERIRRASLHQTTLRRNIRRHETSAEFFVRRFGPSFFRPPWSGRPSFMQTQFGSRTGLFPVRPR